MGKDKSSLIASSRKFAQKNKFCMFLAICYITVVVFGISFYKHFRTQIIRIVCLAALFAAFVLITSFNPVVYNLEYYNDYELSDEEIEISEDIVSDIEEMTDEYVNDSVSDEAFDKDDWNLILVNKQNKIPDDYDFELVSIDGKLSCDKRILDSFDIVTLVGDLMDEFDVEIGAEHMIPENFNSAEAIYNLIQSLED